MFVRRLAFAGYVPGATFPGGLPDAEPAWGESLPPLLWIGQGQGANGGLLTLVGVAFDEVAGAFRVPLGWPFSFGSFSGTFVLDVADGQPRTDGQPGGLGSRVEGRRKEVRLGNPVERQSNGFVTLSMHDCERSPPIRSATG